MCVVACVPSSSGSSRDCPLCYAVCMPIDCADRDCPSAFLPSYRRDVGVGEVSCRGEVVQPGPPDFWASLSCSVGTTRPPEGLVGLLSDMEREITCTNNIFWPGSFVGKR